MENTENEDFMLFEEENEILPKHYGYDYDYTEEYKKEKSLHFVTSKNTEEKNKCIRWDSTNKNKFLYTSLEIIPKCNSDFNDIKRDEVKMNLSLHSLKTDLSKLAQHNLKDYLNEIDQKKRHNIPMLWMHNYETIYATNYTDKQRTMKKLRYINNLL